MASHINGGEEVSIHSQQNGSTPAPKRKRQLKLTAAQRERKRAIDREAQRSIRTKTKNYVAHLENLVKVLEENDSAPNGGQEGGRTRHLMAQLRQSEEEVRKLRDMVVGIQKMIGGVLEETVPAIEEKALSNGFMFSQPFSHTEAFQSQSSSPHSTSDTDYRTSTVAILERKTPTEIPRSSYAEWRIQPTPYFGRQLPASALEDGSLDSLPPPPVPPDPGRRQFEGELLYYSEAQIRQAVLRGGFPNSNEPFDDDIAIRAALQGWSTVEDQYSLDEGWQAIKKIDQANFNECGVLERLAMFRLMRLKILHQALGTRSGSNGGLPAYMNQEVTGWPVVEHFAWPGFRAAVYQRPAKYINNAFSDTFRRCFKFLWTGDVSDAYRRDPTTQLYSCSPDFVQRWYDLRCWTMRRDLFDGAEELFCAIAVYEGYAPRYWPPSGSATAHDHAARSTNAALSRGDGQDLNGSSTAVRENGVVSTSLSHHAGVQSWLANGDVGHGIWQDMPLAHGYSNIGISHDTNGYMT